MLLPSGWGCPPALLLFGGDSISRDLSIFGEESGSQKGHSAYCVVSLVFHEQEDALEGVISSLEADLERKSLPALPFHASPLMYGKAPYKDLEMETRKRMFASFEAFCRRTPFACKTFAYRRSEVPSSKAFTARFKKDLVVFLTGNLEYFQAFGKVKIYYDNGQQMVTHALHSAIDFVLSKEAVLYRMADARQYRLSRPPKTCSRPNARSQAGLWCILQLCDMESPSLTVKDSSVSV